MRTTRARLDQLSEVTRRNHDRDIAHSEWLFQMRKNAAHKKIHQCANTDGLKG